MTSPICFDLMALVDQLLVRDEDGFPLDYSRLHVALLEEALGMARKKGWPTLLFDRKQIGGSKAAWQAWLQDDPWTAILPGHPVSFSQVARLERVIVALSFCKEVAHATTD